MKVLVSKYNGFCFGVKRAIQIANQAVESKKTNQRIYTIGPIIHNPRVVADLEKKGLNVANSENNVKKGSKVIIRSHGVADCLVKKMRDKGIDIIDATCPCVKRSQNYCKLLLDEGYCVVIAGKKEHPEISAMLQPNKNIKVVLSEKQVSDLKFGSNQKIGLIAQTTLSSEVYSRIRSKILEKDNSEIRIFNTICKDASNRQREAYELASICDVMLIVGGYNSANTNTLAQICKKVCKNVYKIETKDDLDEKWFHAKKSIGISAGASTPACVVKSVIKKLDKMTKDVKIYNHC